MVIQESKNLNHFPIEELIGSLMTYEMTCNAHEELKNNLPKNRKDLTLRINEDDLSESSSDDDFELLTIKLKKILFSKLFHSFISLEDF